MPCPGAVPALAAPPSIHEVRAVTSDLTPRASPGVPRAAVGVVSRDHRWLADRARNAIRHPLRIGLVAAVVCLASLVALVVVPQRQRRAAERLPDVAARVDTVVLLTRDAAIHDRLTAADRAVDSLRAALSGLERAEEAAATARSARRGVPTTTRDSLTVFLAELSRLIDRATSAPLLASYRALAGARALAGDAHVRALADSLGDIEQRREAFGAAGGVDPVYVGLTAQAAAIGRAIGDVAERRRVALRHRLAEASSGVFADAPALAGLDSVRATLDTAPALAALDSLRRSAEATGHQLDVARATNARIMTAVAVARERANVATPPLAMLVATLVLGIVLGMLVSLVQETTRPRLSGAAEIERRFGARVIGTLDGPDPGASGPGAPSPGARAAGETATRIARRLLSISDASPRVAVIGDNPGVVGMVVMALAVAAADDARAVLLIDTDSRHAPLLRRLRRRGSAGVTDVLIGGAQWADTLLAHVGSHSLAIDIIPPGAPIARAPLTANVERAGAALARYAAAWDLVLFAVTSVDRPIVDMLLAYAGVRDAIVCAQVGETELATLAAEHRGLERRQVRHRGVVLTDGWATVHAWRAADQAVAVAH